MSRAVVRSSRSSFVFALLGVVSLWIAPTLFASSSCLDFATARPYDTGDFGNPKAAAMGDFNADNKLDLVMAEWGTNRIAVFLGNGDGTFGTVTRYGLGVAAGQPLSVALGDFNNDGKVDIVTANGTTGNVTVFLGVGNGTFGAPVSYGAGTAPNSVVVGLFNGDSNLDLAVANKSSGNVSILLGTGTGTFGAATNIAVGSSAYSIAVGNFDGGALDLAVATANGVVILIGSGTGTFAASSGSPFAAGTLPESVAISDFNGDTFNDLAVANRTSNNVSILLGFGDGSFASAVNYGSVGTLTHGSFDLGDRAVASGDFNGDGKKDLAVVAMSSGYISILIGVGDGTFTAGNRYAAGSAPFSVSIADLNNDSKVDLVVPNFSSSEGSVLIGNGDGTFVAVLFYDIASFRVFNTSVVTADFNGDGKTDLAVTSRPLDSTGALAIFLGSGNGTFVRSASYAAAPSVNLRSAAVGDFNHDGKIDLAVGNGTGVPPTSTFVSIYLGVGDGTFSAPVNFTTPDDSRTVATGDFNNDGHLDLAVAGGGNRVAILLGVGNGTFGAATTFATGTFSYAVATADFNGDSKLDLAVANDESGDVSILLGIGNGTFQTAVQYAVASNPRWVALGDLNADGKIDLAVSNWGSNNVTVRLGVGDGTFGTATHYAAGTQAHFVTIGDFDGDGRPDLAVANNQADPPVISFLLGNGDGTFGAAVNLRVPVGSKALAAADLNGDGKVDLAAPDVGIILNRSTCPMITSILPNSGPTAGGQSVTISGSNLTGATSVTFGGSSAEITGNTSTSVTVTTPAHAVGTVDVVVTTAVGAPISRGGYTYNPADLTITKSHTGNFTQGETGRTYAITVNNAGGAATSGTVTVVDTLPAGLYATAIAGTGWTCTLATLTCTRSDALAAASSYPQITLTVTVASNAPASVTNTATVSGGGQTNTGNDTATDPTTINAGGLVAPTNLIATAGSASTASVTWDAVSVAVLYQVFRSSNNGAFTFAGSSMTTTFPDSGLTPNTTYLYQVRAVNASDTVGPPSNTDLTTTIVFTDDPLVAGTTVIKAVHLTELRTAVNAVRIAGGLTPATFTDPSPAGIVVRAIHIMEVRTRLGEARVVIGVPAIAYTDSGLTAGTTVKRAHFQELRTGVK